MPREKKIKVKHVDEDPYISSYAGVTSIRNLELDRWNILPFVAVCKTVTVRTGKEYNEVVEFNVVCNEKIVAGGMTDLIEGMAVHDKRKHGARE